MMSKNVFISYSNSDKNIAYALCSKLESNNIKCWIAPRDIRAGSTWASAIVHGIDASNVFLLIFSNNSNNSDQVLREVERAVSKKLIIIPVRIEDILPTGAMEYYLSAVHWLDLFSPQIDEELEKLVRLVKQVSYQVDPNSDREQPVDNGISRTKSVFSFSHRSKIILLSLLGIFFLVSVVLFNKVNSKHIIESTKIIYPKKDHSVLPSEIIKPKTSKDIYPSSEAREIDNPIILTADYDPGNGVKLLLISSDELFIPLHRGGSGKFEFMGEDFTIEKNRSYKITYFVYSKENFRFNSDLPSRLKAIKKEFGQGAELAAFEDIKAMSMLISSPRLIDELDLRAVKNPEIIPYDGVEYWNQGPFVTYQGRVSEGSKSYFISVHDGILMKDWAVVETIDNHNIDLGRWHNNRKVLVKITIPVTITVNADKIFIQEETK